MMLVINVEIILLLVYAFLIYFGLTIIGYVYHFMHINYGVAAGIIAIIFRITYILYNHPINLVCYYISLIFTFLLLAYSFLKGDVSKHELKEKKCLHFEPCPCNKCLFGICKTEESGKVFRQKFQKACNFYNEK